MSIVSETFQRALAALVAKVLPGATHVEGLRRLSAGATSETWAFDAVGNAMPVRRDDLPGPCRFADKPSGDPRHPLILRRAAAGLRRPDKPSLATEAELLRRLGASGVPVPPVVHTLQPEDELEEGFLMTRIAGQTIPRKILRDAPYDAIRPHLIAQLAAALAGIHRVDTGSLPALPVQSVTQSLEQLRCLYDRQGSPRPVFELALRWLVEHMPADSPKLGLVHGDYRLGNVIVGSEGVRAVLDWEMAHLGDPAEDLAWICLPPWRFGRIDQPVAGLGDREILYTAYERAGGERVDPRRTRFWEMMGSLRWGVACAEMVDWFRSGKDASAERAMIARRASENEMDLMRMLTESE